MPQGPDLLDLYKLHSEEVRFQVQLNWDRAKSSLTFHVAMLALVAGLGGKVIGRPLAVAMLLSVALSAVLCAGILHIGHGYYRKARNRRREVEQQLGVSLGFVTTDGMRGEEPKGLARVWPNINTILIALHLMLSALAVAGAWTA